MAGCVVIYWTTLECAEWKKLTSSEKVAYLYLRKKCMPGKNGSIALSYQDMKDVLSAKTFSRAIKGLIVKGWIERTKHGGMYRYYNLFKITWLYDREPKRRKRR